MEKQATITVTLELQDVLDYIKQIKHDIELGVIEDAIGERSEQIMDNQLEFDFDNDEPECDCCRNYDSEDELPTYEQLLETNKALTDALHALTGKEMK